VNYLVREAITPALGRYPRFTRSHPVTRGTVSAGAAPMPAHRAIIPTRSSRTRGGIAGLCAGACCSRPAASASIWSRDCRTPAFWPPISSRADGLPILPAPVRAVLSHRCGSRAGVRQHELISCVLYDALQGARLYRIHGYRGGPCGGGSRHYQIPSAAADGALFAQFFEDHDVPLIAPLGRHESGALPVGKASGARAALAPPMPVR